jgi:hypothetical protein
MKELQFEGS